MRIGELAEQTGVSVRSLRYYEQQQLLLSTRTTGGQRVFARDAVDRVQLIQLLYAAGVPSKSILELLPCLYTGTVTEPMFERLLAERDRIGEQARILATTLDRLDEVIVESRRRLPGSRADEVSSGSCTLG